MEPFCLIGVYPLGWGAGWAVTSKKAGYEISEAEKPIDTDWTVKVKNNLVCLRTS
jgi:hypothetical protein